MCRSIATAFLVFAASEAAARVQWTVDSVSVLDIPGMASDGSLTFASADGALRLGDGKALHADRGENTIRVVDASGKLLRSAGHTGEGPGEFQSITSGA